MLLFHSESFIDKKMDTDDPEHIGWLYNIAAARAKEFKIEGVTWSLTQGVVKNIIPAIASTNAIIAGTVLFIIAFTPALDVSPQHHAVMKHSRLLPVQPLISTTTSCSLVLMVYILTPLSTNGALNARYAGESLLNSQSVETGLSTVSLRCWWRNRICAFSAIVWFASRTYCGNSQIKKPSLSTPTKQIYFQAPPQLEQATRPNLEKRVSELVPDGGEVTVTASSLPFSLSLRITFI
jgi:ubiquitin-activating enzyme E1 C